LNSSIRITNTAPLPVFLTPLIGREQELATLEQLLRHPDVRLVTLTGPGGVGKTRLAVAAASNLADDFPEAITFVSLVPVTDPDFVFPAIAAALGIQDSEDANRSALDQITRYLHEKPYLLIIDNFEHVIEAAPTIPNLLAVCPNLIIIVTSRQILRVRGEQEFAVPLLGMPDIGRLAHDADLATVLPRYSAVQLFLERMRAIQVDYEPDQAALRAIAGICIHLDGLPLAIELAAPRTRMFTPGQLLAQLGGGQGASSLKLLTGGARDLPARQRTLSRTIQWSYDLLPAEEQRVFRAASIFAGAFALTEAEKLLERPSDKQIEPALTDIMASLVEKNLLRQDTSDAEPRFRMLVTLQAFGRAEARRLGEMPALNAAHARTFLELAEATVPRLYTHEQIEMTARLRRDVDNLKRALRWVLDQGEMQSAARFGSALWRFWLLGGLLSEGQGWLKEILARLGYDLENAETGRPQISLEKMQTAEIGRLAELLYGLGCLAHQRGGGGRPEVAYWLSQSRDLYLQIGDRTQAAFAMTALARTIYSLHEDLAESRRLLDESYAILKEADHKSGMAENLHAQAHNYFFLNQPEKAAEAMADCLALLRETGNIYELAQATQFAGDLAFGRIGSWAKVRRHYSEAAEMFAALGNATEAAVTHAMVGLLNGVIDGEWSGALALVEEGRRIAHEHGNESAAAFCTAMTSWVYSSLGNYDQAKSIACETIRAASSLSHHTALGIAFVGLANAERLAGNNAAAVTAVSALMSYRMYYDSLAYSRGNSIHFASLSQTKHDLAPVVFEQAWFAGPERLAELLPQSETERTPWPLAPIPEMDAAETPGQQIPDSKEAAAPPATLPEPLTAREKDVLKCLIQGMTDAQIAEALVVSPRTVHAHLRNIYGKLGVNTRTAATRLALEHGLI
jgi:predicted ATPase/DNA-binding CsgD family transcriptional regulator